MKVILLKEVQQLGHAGEVKEVNDGYARNYLIPNDLADFYSESNFKKIQAHLKKKKTKK